MATPLLIPVSEYLTTSYRPDRDYIDGEVKERNLGETPHATIQLLLAAIFLNNRDAWGLRSFTEQRVQVSPTRFRIPDVCAIRIGIAPGPILRTPPLVCVEVLSPEDSLSAMTERIDDYLQMGVENIWLIDPVRRRAWFATSQGVQNLTEDAFTITGTPVRIPLAQLYHELDELAAGR